MNEFLKLPGLDKDDVRQLYHVKPWWEKALARELKRLRHWLVRFKDSPESFFQHASYAIDDYEQLFRDVNNLAPYFNRKLKQIMAHKRIFRRFQKMMIAYLNLLGICWMLHSVMTYFWTVDTKAIANKKAFGYELGNGMIDGVYARFKKELYQFAGTVDGGVDVLDKIFVGEKKLAQHLFEPRFFVNLVIKYLTQLHRGKKIDEEAYLNGIYKAMACMVTTTTYSRFYQIFLNQLI